MGKGDQKSTRGKRNAGSYGKTRLKKRGKNAMVPVKVLNENEELAQKQKVRKELPAQTEPTENAEKPTKKTTPKAKKTEE